MVSRIRAKILKILDFYFGFDLMIKSRRHIVALSNNKNLDEIADFGRFWLILGVFS